MKTSLDVKFTAFLGIIVFLILAVFKGPEFWKDLWSNISTAVTIALAIRWVLFKWVWKWKLFRFLESLHHVPYVEGKWTGKYRSSGNDKTPPDRLEGLAELEIHQPDINTLKFVRKSGESTSRSFGENIFREDDGIIQFRYSYLSEPNADVRERSPISYGSAILTYTRGRSEQLNGNYWTDQKTTGTLEFARNNK